MSIKPTPAKPTDDDATKGETAFKRLQPQLDEMSPSGLKRLGFDVRAAATAGITLAERCNAKPLRQRFENLASIKEFHLAYLDNLETVSRASWYVRHRLSQASALHSDARVPEKLVKEGEAVKERMLKVLKFHFEDEPVIGALLKHIIQGTGHQDRAEDLVGLARLYKEHRAELKSTPKFYRDTDEADARRIADETLGELARSVESEYAMWSGYQARVANLLEEHYSEVQEAARFLDRGNPQKDESFPSLYVVARGKSGPRPKEESPPVVPVDAVAVSGAGSATVPAN